MRIPQMLHISTMWMWMDPQCYAQELNTDKASLQKAKTQEEEKAKKQGGRE